ncbi:DNA-binding protein Dps [uncultured Caudovirales phage]|uniref:DNA-binding protein Dps n=1 Tax=uncultured Caudovirales phage TaxID=2100421 RepID=A0A6J5RFH1_9CAUD|nr:DNA-binding protein Dps [uncultured Caudovirales phage]CAB4184893.1 DNA-binding protein Dps [uncultured Caudovirales phage]CAB4192368.1 DNA-binding protein Dps [uncultured Caudovirales phage]CAB5231188.1 DNA-binding protein Dps [uncultured Caudovirales phage]
MDFKVFTNALKAYEGPNGDLFVTGTTSSTIRDLHGDEMTLNALQSMAETAKQNMTIFLNHNYMVPEDLFGSVTDARVVRRWDSTTNSDVCDLDIDVMVCKEDENPEAMRTYKAIKRGVKLGLSIGARVERVSKKKDSSTGEETYVIDSIKLMEASVVGIPANQRSYLQNAIKSLRSADATGDVEFSAVDVMEIAKAVEVEGQTSADKAPLVGALYNLLAEAAAFYLKAHGAHWNVVGEEFAQYHELFGEIYEDVHASLDPIAENLRKLNSPAPFELKDLARMSNDSAPADDYDAESLAEALYASNESLLENIMVAFKAATDANQQGIANFLADRQDMHQKWSWQLRASLAPEESEPEPAETPEAPEAADTEGEIIVGDAEKATRVTVTVTQSEDKETKKPDANENNQDEAVSAPSEVSKSEQENLVEAEPAAEVAPEADPVVEAPVEAPAEEPVAPVVEEANAAHEALQALGAVLVRASAGERAHILSKVAAFADGETATVAEAEVAEAVVTEGEAAADEVVEVAQDNVEAKGLDEVTAIAKSALDAAFAAQQEVSVIKSQLTELIAQKAKVESDLAKALDVVGRLMDLPSGRKSYSSASINSGTNAPWLSPVIQRMLDSQE